MKKNFEICKTLEEANEMDLDEYTFINYSDRKEEFLFKLLKKKKNND